MLFQYNSIRWFIQMFVWSLTCQQSVFKRHYSGKHFPTRWRRKPASIDMDRNYVTVALCIVYTYVLFCSRLRTRSTAIAEGPRDASCQLKSCQLPRNSAETTISSFSAWSDATTPDRSMKLLIRQVLTKSMVWSWRFSRRQCVIDNVHSTMTRSSRLPLSQVS